MLIAVAVQDGVARIALLDGDSLIEYSVWNVAAPDGVGDVYTGRVLARVPAMAGWFVELGAVAGFLPDSAAPPGLSVGDYVPVRVTRAAQGGKGPRLTIAVGANASIAAKPGLMLRGPGPLLELAGRFAGARVAVDDYAMIAMLQASLGERVSYRAAAFDAVLEDEVAALHAARVVLPGGAVMHVTPAPALTAIDIDTGSAKDVDLLAFNVSIMPAVARQIVLRNLSGAILIDFAGMKSRHRGKLLPALASALAGDPLRPTLHGFTALGFAEISRPRVRAPLHEISP